MMKVLLLLIFLIGCSKAAPPQSEKRIPVQITQLKIRDVPRYLEAHGILSPLLQADIRSQVAGRVIKIHYEEGKGVEKGQLLVEIDPTVYALRLQEALASLAQRKALLAFAEKKLARYASISGKHLAAIEIDQLEQEAALHAAAVLAEEAKVKQAEIDVQNCSIYAPFSGKIGRSFITEQSFVSAGAHFAILRNIDSLYVEFSLGEKEISDLCIEKSLLEAAPSGSSFFSPGSFVSLDTVIDPKTGMVLAKGIIPNPNHTLWPGQIVSVRLHLGEEKNVAFLPVETIQQNLQGKFVYVINNDGKAEERAVVLGPSQEKEIAIVSGVAPDEKIALKGQLRLYRGASVEIKE